MDLIQQILDAMLKQGQPCLNSAGLPCLRHGNLRCPVGMLIPPAMYEPKLEGMSASRILDKLNITHPLIKDLIIKMQESHDAATKHDFITSFRKELSERIH